MSLLSIRLQGVSLHHLSDDFNLENKCYILFRFPCKIRIDIFSKRVIFSVGTDLSGNVVPC
jgi:hypothetical protein